MEDFNWDDFMKNMSEKEKKEAQKFMDGLSGSKEDKAKQYLKQKYPGLFPVWENKK